VDLLARLSGEFAEALQRVRFAQCLSADPVDAGDRDPGLLVLDDEDGIEMANAAPGAWLDELHDPERRLPLVVTVAAQQARATAAERSAVAATARVRAASGRWVLVRGSVLCNATRARTAVTLEPARAPELAASSRTSTASPRASSA
jgi:hypothetical protein